MSSRILHYRTSPFKVICPFTFIKHLLNYFVYGHPAIWTFQKPLVYGHFEQVGNFSYYLLPIILSSVLPFARSSTSLSRMRRSFIRGSSISSILIPQILPFTPHCCYISANPLIPRTRFFWYPHFGSTQIFLPLSEYGPPWACRISVVNHLPARPIFLLQSFLRCLDWLCWWLLSACS